MSYDTYRVHIESIQPGFRGRKVLVKADNTYQAAAIVESQNPGWVSILEEKAFGISIDPDISA